MELKLINNKIAIDYDFFTEEITITESTIENVEKFFKYLLVYKELGKINEHIEFSKEVSNKLSDMPNEIKSLFDELLLIVNESSEANNTTD